MPKIRATFCDIRWFGPWLALAALAAGCIDSQFVPANGGLADTLADSAANSDAGAEVSLADAAPAGDAAADIAADASASTACPGAPLCACAADADCQNGLCLETADGKKCAAFCVEGNCPAGQTCGAATGTNAAGQPVTKNGVCVPRWARECMACDQDSACVTAADPQAACVDPTGAAGQGGKFCAPSCNQDADCPPNRSCLERTSSAGSIKKYCVPPSGQCICSPLAVQLAAKTACSKTGAGLGVCKGVRACTAAGLQACSAAPAAPEACNGLDDDCDGPIDEPADATPLCDDSNPCTADKCDGVNGCAHLPIDASCSDGDACTQNDACKSGKCSGAALDCDDKNPCTADTCDKTDGCASAPKAGPCDDGSVCTKTDLCDNGFCNGSDPLGCSDNNPCTADYCEAKAGCIYLPTDATCSDGNACTGVDVCKGGKCQGPALLCDDGWGCTADTCDPSNGCTFKPGPATCGYAKLPYKVAFGCGEPLFAAWKVSAPGISVANPKPPPVAWQVDDTPSLGGVAQCALNVNNGKDLACGFGQNALQLTADSPWIDSSAASPGAPLILRLESAGLWASTQSAKVYVRSEVGAFVEQAKLPASATVWGKVNIDLAVWAGKTFQIRLEFSAPDCTAAAGTGWFVRNLELQVDPCVSNNGGCASIATCSATPAGTAACACPSGYTGDGKTCTDIDECATGAAKCDTKGACKNLPGSFTCGCKPGFAGDGVICTDIDECKSGLAFCAPTATCTNTEGSFNCTCPSGYAGDGKTCNDIDECQTNNGGCAAQAVCSNTPGSFQCACKPGYSGDGKTCTDTDECAAALPACATDATCTNTPGSFSCACKPGYLGDGKSCLLYGGQDAPATTCKAILTLNPAAKSGNYYLVVAGSLVQVGCDMVTDGGGWTQIAYKADLPMNNNIQKNPQAFIYLPSDFQTVLTAAQIKALQAVSKEGRQTYVGLCNRMVHYFYANTATYSYAFGFKFLDGSESAAGLQSYAPDNITVSQDGCKNYASESGNPALATIFVINSPKVPVVNVKYKTVGTNFSTKFGSPLTQNPAMLR